MSDVAARNRRNKRNGTVWESMLRDGLRGLGFDYEKLRLAGKEDEGDGVIRLPDGNRIVIEAKSGELKASEFVKEATAEARNYEAHRGLPARSVKGITIVKKRGASWVDGYVLTSVREFFGIES